ncbi:DUF2878 domain-containing protein [Paraglaciecola hydrolytica]|uniref:DUF2878 domain-containing protein n=1 Tax=Paraglaciecola hydrolytica TaxID=1799789 RepID=A0A136A3Y9_9ALTE|nr:DUF2878 domain-containing protein [Paraglaciecola hydrolytica]KXI29934.1 hypothetical protein AX660_07910 [Paraglaciecola hydrolytica]
MRAFWLINAVLFQLGWFGALLLNQHAVAILSITLVLHFFLSPSKKADALILLLAPIGWLMDYSLFQFNVLGAGSAGFPIWLLLLWLMFVVSLNHSLKWLSQISLFGVGLLGMILGPLSYLSAIKVGVLNSSLTSTFFVLLAAALWALLLPSLVKLRYLLLGYFTIQQIGTKA